MDGDRRGREVAGDGTDAAWAPGPGDRPRNGLEVDDRRSAGREDDIGGFGGGPAPVGEGDFTVRARVRARERIRRRG